MQRVLLLPTFFFLVSVVLGTLAVVHAEPTTSVPTSPVEAGSVNL